MTNEKDLEKKLEHAFQKSGVQLPEDKYFKKIWDTIEVKAPVGEKYYLRFIFSMLLVFFFLVIFIFFYTDFLSSVLTLKEIRSENLKAYNTAGSQVSTVTTLGPAAAMEIAKGIRVSAVRDSKILLNTEDTQMVVLDFFYGHVKVEKISKDATLIINMPDVTLKMTQGRCNLFCYDNIVRIIPLSFPVEIEFNGKKQTVPPGDTFYLLDGKGVRGKG